MCLLGQLRQDLLLTAHFAAELLNLIFELALFARVGLLLVLLDQHLLAVSPAADLGFVGLLIVFEGLRVGLCPNHINAAVITFCYGAEVCLIFVAKFSRV